MLSVGKVVVFSSLLQYLVSIALLVQKFLEEIYFVQIRFRLF